MGHYFLDTQYIPLSLAKIFNINFRYGKKRIVLGGGIYTTKYFSGGFGGK